jgi:hypothetical protein
VSRPSCTPPLEHHNDRLAHYPLVTADNRIRGVTSAQHHPSA